MAKYSESLFEGIRNFGRQDPASPARKLETATPYKQMGTSDPLARSLGNLFGNVGFDSSSMQTGEERAGAAMAEAGKQQFASPEGRMIAMLKAQLPNLTPQAQMKVMGQIGELTTIEQARVLTASVKIKDKAMVSNLASQLESVDPKLAALILAEQDSKGEAYKLGLGYFGKQENPEYSSSRKVGMVRDEEGNLYEAQLFTRNDIVTGQDPTVLDYSPFSVDAPSTPVGKLSPVRTSGETPDEMLVRQIALIEARTDAQIKSAGEGELAREYARSVGTADQTFSSSSEAVNRLSVLSQLASELETGGFTQAINLKFQKFFNTVPTNMGSFQNLAGTEMLKMLKPTFGGTISDPEREVLTELQANVTNSSNINSEIIKRSLEEARRRKAISGYLVTNPARAEYVSFVKSVYEEDASKKQGGRRYVVDVQGNATEKN